MNTPPGFPNPQFPQGPPTGGQPLSPPTAPPGSTPIPGVPLGAPAGGPPMGPPPAGGPPPAYGTPGPTPGWTPEPPQSSSKIAYIALAVVAAIGIGAIAFVLTRSDDAKKVQADVTIPTFTIPDITIPNITIPDITIPNITIPDITIPDITIPEITIPTVTIPPVTIPEVPTTVAAPPTNLFTGTQAQDVVAQFATARGAAPLRILQALFYPEYAFAQVQDPSIPANVDEYQWRSGSVGAPAPVMLTGDGDLESNLFSDNEVNWAAIPGLVEAALAQIPIEGAAVSHISVQRNLPFTADVQIRVFVSGTRSSGYLDADAQGNIINVSQG